MKELSDQERAEVRRFGLDRGPRHLLMPTLGELLKGIGEADVDEDCD